MASASEELVFEDAGSKRVHLDYLRSSEPVRKLPTFGDLRGDLYPHNFDTQPVEEMNEDTLMTVRPAPAVSRTRKRSSYKKRSAVSYLDFLEPSRRSYKSKKRYVSKSRKYQKPVRRGRRVSKPAVRASASCSCSHGGKSYARRSVKSTRRKRR